MNSRNEISEEFLGLQRALAGQYSLERELGRGGMGVVLLAREIVLDRPVAIKVLLATVANDPVSRERFLREARIAGSLFHPNIVPIHRVDIVEEFVFFVMGYVDGVTVSARVNGGETLEISEAVRVLRDVAWALSYAHERGIVHRDVKPENIIIERNSGRALVVDFGIAQLHGTQHLTAEGQLIGSAHCMSPEQISGGAVDGRSDLYALGIVAHVLLHGQAPFESPVLATLLAMQLTKEPPSIVSLVPALPARVGAAIDRCLKKNREERFATISEFLEAIAEADREEVLPEALRAWVAGTDVLGGGFLVSLLTTFVLVASTIAPWPILFVPVLWVFGDVFRTIGRLLTQGFQVRELRRALASEVERARHHLKLSARPRLADWALLRRFAKLFTASALVAAGVWWFVSYVEIPLPAVAPKRTSAILRIVVTKEISGLMAIVSTVAAALFAMVAEFVAPSSLSALLDLRRYQFRLWIWNHTRARWLRLLYGRQKLAPSQINTDGRRTEAILGSAILAIYEALPKATQRDLRHLPSIADVLTDRTVQLRERIENLERLAALGGRLSVLGSSVSGDKKHTGVDFTSRTSIEDVSEALAESRLNLKRRLELTVAALEGLRLDLLRLYAGNNDTVKLYEDMDAATRLGDEIDRLLSSRIEVDQLLRKNI